MTNKRKIIIANTVQIIIFGIFVTSLITKIIDSTNYVTFLAKLGVEYNMIAMSRSLIILIESAVLLFIIVGNYNKVYLYLMYLLLFFNIFFVYALVKNVNSSCGCFGNIYIGSISYLSIMRNIILALLCYYVHKNYKYVLNIYNIIKKNESYKV
jgi:hypothetical protein